MIKAATNIADEQEESVTSAADRLRSRTNESTGMTGMTGMTGFSKKPALTKRQREIYEFLRDKIVNRGYGPTVREIGVHFSIRSPNGVMCHLKALERKGLISGPALMTAHARRKNTSPECSSFLRFFPWHYSIDCVSF